MTRPSRVIAAGTVVVALAVGLAGCSDEAPTWSAVDATTCDRLDLAGKVASAYPSAAPASVEADSRSGGLAGEGGSDAVCEARVDADDGGRMVVLVEIASSGTPGGDSLYDQRDGGEVSVAGQRVHVDPVPVDGWWDKGVRVATTSSPRSPEAAVVHLTVSDDNLVVAVSISDWRGADVVDPEAGTALADRIVDAVPDLVGRR